MKHFGTAISSVLLVAITSLAGGESLGQNAAKISAALKLAEAAANRVQLAQTYASAAAASLNDVETESNPVKVGTYLRNSITWRVLAINHQKAALADLNDADAALQGSEHQKGRDELAKAIDQEHIALIETYRIAIKAAHEMRMPEEVAYKEEFAKFLEKRAKEELADAAKKSIP